jgi:hypothetical protein
MYGCVCAHAYLCHDGNARVGNLGCAHTYELKSGHHELRYVRGLRRTGDGCASTGVYVRAHTHTIVQQALLADRAVRAAMAKTSQGRRPTTGAVGGGGARMATAMQRTQTGMRPTTAMNVSVYCARTHAVQAAARPMTAVRGAGYQSRSKLPT